MSNFENADRQVSDKGEFWGDNRGRGGWVLLNEMYPSDSEGSLGVCTVALQIDGIGCIVQTIASSVKQCSVSQCFVPGVKIEECTDRPVGYGNEEHDAEAKIISRKLVPIKYSNVVMD